MAKEGQDWQGCANIEWMIVSRNILRTVIPDYIVVVVVVVVAVVGTVRCAAVELCSADRLVSYRRLISFLVVTVVVEAGIRLWSMKYGVWSMEDGG